MCESRSLWLPRANLMMAAATWHHRRTCEYTLDAATVPRRWDNDSDMKLLALFSLMAAAHKACGLRQTKPNSNSFTALYQQSPPKPIDDGGCHGHSARWLHNLTALRVIMRSHPKTDMATKHNYHVMYHEYLAPLAERK